MCGICFICGFSEDDILNHVSASCMLIERRGPDCYQKKELKINGLCAVFQASVLWLQGSEPSPQPFSDEHENILLWNGDILAGHEVPGNDSDTKYVSDSLASKNEEEIISFMSEIKGPWSFIYYMHRTRKLYFGRDVFGRHSLLWKLPSDSERIFMLTSVYERDIFVKEIPALGIYYVDLDTSIVSANFCVNLIPWSHISDESLLQIDPCIQSVQKRILSPVKNSLNMSIPSEDTLKLFNSLPSTLDESCEKVLYSLMSSEIDNVTSALKCSLQRRIDKSPPRCKNCTKATSTCSHSKVAVMFSGGLDSAVIALLADSCLMSSESIDLLNVAFPQKTKIQGNDRHKMNKSVNAVLEEDNLELADYEVPDRLTGRECWRQLQEIRPERNWNFVEINVTSEKLARERDTTICHLVAPLQSVLDDSIGCALWFGGHGQGYVMGRQYASTARVILCGMGADEQLCGYSRHRGRYKAGGWPALLEEINMEISRIHTRNLGRDNRILADHGRAPRFPYLDEDVVATLNALPIWMKANLNMGRGMGEKLILRVAASHLGLTAAARYPKRAIQFGSRIAKLENSKEKGSDSCSRLIDV
ncbi:Asparagine synthetase domain-containing protein 1 [Halocaridina rubra]|uniref:Asparagine synthetase domain-containing protein 1 n=1 Tax=Halocaridina rubra TaxID=373956 RepID=A0AAN8X4Q1_HALRR